MKKLVKIWKYLKFIDKKVVEYKNKNLWYKW